MVKFIIRKSISTGMRTKEDWLNFRKQQKAIEENTLIEWSIEDEEENHIEKNDDTQTEEATPEKTHLRQQDVKQTHVHCLNY